MNLSAARRFALSLPEAHEAPHFHFTSFRVGTKIFATAPPGEALLHVFVDDHDREAAVALHPAFVEPLPWGSKIVGVRVALARADPRTVEHLLERAWSRKAPKRLLAARQAS